MQTDFEILSDVDVHLREAEQALAIAIAKFGPRCGGYWRFSGAWRHYKRAIGTLLRLRDFRNQLGKAIQRAASAPSDRFTP
ncbi:hypothetical protein [Paraburkholderia adhaesiva]|uniref:hypothetical protein n=1 Tax=Paraburkholderia adhaesiva TaxID=2883244 RepID=UPI001F244C8C|nr:hypothetical protein [Paraburkholderia adhaesiva]